MKVTTPMERQTLDWLALANNWRAGSLQLVQAWVSFRHTEFE